MVVHIDETGKGYMRRGYEPRELVDYMQRKTAGQPNERKTRAMRCVQGMDHLYQLRGMTWIRFYDLHKAIQADSGERFDIKDWSFVDDISNTSTMRKVPSREESSRLENLEPLFKNPREDGEDDESDSDSDEEMEDADGEGEGGPGQGQGQQGQAQPQGAPNRPQRRAWNPKAEDWEAVEEFYHDDDERGAYDAMRRANRHFDEDVPTQFTPSEDDSSSASSSSSSSSSGSDSDSDSDSAPSTIRVPPPRGRPPRGGGIGSRGGRVNRGGRGGRPLNRAQSEIISLVSDESDDDSDDDSSSSSSSSSGSSSTGSSGSTGSSTGSSSSSSGSGSSTGSSDSDLFVRQGSAPIVIDDDDDDDVITVPPSRAPSLPRAGSNRSTPSVIHSEPHHPLNSFGLAPGPPSFRASSIPRGTQFAPYLNMGFTLGTMTPPPPRNQSMSIARSWTRETTMGRFMTPDAARRGSTVPSFARTPTVDLTGDDDDDVVMGGVGGLQAIREEEDEETKEGDEGVGDAAPTPVNANKRQINEDDYDDEDVEVTDATPAESSNKRQKTGDEGGDRGAEGGDGAGLTA